VPTTEDDEHVCRPGFCFELTDPDNDDESIWWHAAHDLTYVSFGGQHGWERYPTTEPLLPTYLRAIGIHAI
jgi:hypothetical protein